MEWQRGEYLLTDQRERVDAARIFELLQQTYWGTRRPLAVVESMLRHSLCFTLLLQQRQIGFGRAVTDYTAFSWIADIVIEPAYRGQGLGCWLMSCIVTHPELRDTQFVLQTRDAHGLYAKFGFAASPKLMSTPVSGL